ncbi:unnamed protein product [Notodromas monacha]|uniref:Beta-lactamase-like protein 2 homolog n=1 Tax=Notodromas monacha TaxID=399045 RepID=A0A7R9G9N4_9CRUS|nr:unnamed protein product [Notodromas monacha]CAG0912787.1 unnamed protein product [Notodromas monacha]
MALGKLTELPQIAKLSPSVMRILGCNPGIKTLQGTNTYLVGTGAKRVLIDASEPEKPSYMANVKQVLKEESVTISDIVVTHWHPDHLGGVQQLLSTLPSAPNVRKLPLEGETFEYEIQKLVDGQEIRVEGASLRVIHTPGHTKDHVVLLDTDRGALFSGDCILGETTAVFEDYVSYMASLKKILDLEPKVIYPGHGPVVDQPCDKIRMYIKHREQREKQYLDVLTKQSDFVSASFIAKDVYVGLEDFMLPAAAENVTVQLRKLKAEGKVLQDGDSDKWKLAYKRNA